MIVYYRDAASAVSSSPALLALPLLTPPYGAPSIFQLLRIELLVGSVRPVKKKKKKKKNDWSDFK